MPSSSPSQPPQQPNEVHQLQVMTNVSSNDATLPSSSYSQEEEEETTTKMTARTSTVTTPRQHHRRRRRRTSSSEDNGSVSGLSSNDDDDQTAVSKAASVTSILSQAAMILLGKNPTIPEGEEYEDGSSRSTSSSGIVGRSVPGGRKETSPDDDDDDNVSLLKGTPTPGGAGGRGTFFAANGTANTPVPNGGGGGSSPNPSSMKGKKDTSKTAGKDATNNQKSGIDFLQDDPSTMTYGRRLALFLSQRYAWYNPHLSGDDGQKVGEKATSEEEEEEEEEEECIGDTIHPLLRKSIEQHNDGMDNSFASKYSYSSGSPKNGDSRHDHHQHDGAYPFTHSRREIPSLEKAWAYFDHVALSRYVVEDDGDGNDQKKKKCFLVRIYRKLFCKADKQMQRAEPGERNWRTVLYHPIFTPHAQLGDFGLGIGLYFSTLRAITFLTLVAGLINVSNFIYYGSDTYNPEESNFDSFVNITLQTLLQGSAICTDTSWVLCPGCNPQDFEDNRRAHGLQLGTGQNVTDLFYLKNNCEQSNIQASMINLGTLLWIMAGTIFLSMYLRRMEIAYDEDEQTAQDYSIVIANPPADATDPSEWHEYFKESFDGAHVTACTVAVDNDLLVRSLVERREKLRQIQLMVEPGTSLDTLTLAGIAAKLERERRMFGRLKAIVVPGIPELFARIQVLTAKVQGLAQQTYPATNIFVSFETERDQRKVLTAFNVGTRDIKRNNTSAVADPKHLFRGQYVLKVSEPDEPSTVRWQDLNEKLKDRLKQQLMTTIATVVSIVLIALLVRVLNDASLEFSAIAIALFNGIFPVFAKALTQFEAHSSENGKQRSLYTKIALFRWVNTAVIFTIITPFTSTLTEGSLINRIYALFFAEIVTTNFIQFLDPMGHINRHLLAPRAKTQDAMNLKMQGQVFELAERYTDMTKILFLALWYCALYPGALFLCSFALTIKYFMDRFSLMRTWKRAPQLGTKISEFSRRYFFSLAIAAMSIMSSYYWAGFPFDNLCLIEDSPADFKYAGPWIIAPIGTDNQFNITFPVYGPAYQFCLQDFFRFPKGDWAFPFIPDLQLENQEWMTSDQELITAIQGWSSVAVIGLVLMSFAWSWYGSFMSYFRGTYTARGEDQEINFSDVPSISSYVPEVHSAVFSYPLIASNLDGIDPGLLEWTDPDRPHAFYDLTKDAKVLLRGTDVSSKVVFSQIGHWPPKKKREST